MHLIQKNMRQLISIFQLIFSAYLLFYLRHLLYLCLLWGDRNLRLFSLSDSRVLLSLLCGLYLLSNQTFLHESWWVKREVFFKIGRL
jgi:hypothetical protein